MNKQKVYTYGLGKSGELGNNLKSNREITPFLVPNLPQCSSVSAGGGFSLALSTNGELYTAGKSKHGRNGSTDSKVFVKVRLPVQISQIAAGYWHSLLLDVQSFIWASGYNNYGQLGIGSSSSQNTFVQTQTQALSISAGGHVSLSISLDNKLFSCGKSSGHQSPVQVFTQIPNLDGVSFISAGMVHSACVASGQLFTWGNNTWAQLGHSGHRNSETPQVVSALNGIEIVKASCSKGEKHASTGCIDRNGRVFMWGSGYKGKLGLDRSWSHEDPADRDLPEIIEGFLACEIELGGIHSSAVSDGHLFTWGCGSDGRIGHPEVEGHRYLYKEPLPRPIDSFSSVQVVSSSYYHNIFIA